MNRKLLKINTIQMPNTVNEGYWLMETVVLQKMFLAYVHKIKNLKHYMEESVIEISPYELVNKFNLFKSTRWFNTNKDSILTDMENAKIRFFSNEGMKKITISIFPTTGWDKEKQCFIVGLHKDLWKEVQLMQQTNKEYMLNETLDMVELKSPYASRIYSFLLQYSRCRNLRRVINYSDLRKFLYLKETSYPNFSEFNRTILKKSVKNINDKNLPVHNVECTYVKDGWAKNAEKSIIFTFEYDHSKSRSVSLEADNSQTISVKVPKSDVLTNLEKETLENLFFDKCLETKQTFDTDQMSFIFRRLKSQYSIEELADIYSLPKKQFDVILDYKNYYDVTELLDTGTAILRSL